MRTAALPAPSRLALASLAVLSAWLQLGPGLDARQKESARPHEPVAPPAGGGAPEHRWYSGDTHEHVQYCDTSVHPVREIRARMEAEGLNVASVLIWHYQDLRFTDFICALTGAPDPLSREERILQFGVETSQLACGKWGHLIGLNVGPDQARIVEAALLDGACDDMDGLGLGVDGTGLLNSSVARHFYYSPETVCGYAHCVWTSGLYHALGHDWKAELLASGFTKDAVYLDPDRKLAVPNVPRLMGIGYPLSAQRAFLPLLGPMDAAVGNVQFIETVIMGLDLPMNIRPAVDWNELWYKLLSAGVRVALAGGTDRACMSFSGADDYVRTYVRVEGELTYDAWTRNLAAGRTSIAAGPGAFLRLTLGGAEVGSDVYLHSPDARGTAVVELEHAGAIDDGVELLVDGEVVDVRPIVRAEGGTVSVTFADVSFPESAWVAARLASLRAHTGAVWAIVDGRPAVDPVWAEYWMLWCDIVAKTTLDHPEIGFFGRQRSEALALIAEARRAFKTLRDVHGIDPAWDVARYGTSTPGCRGPIAIGVEGPAESGASLLFSCANAPPVAHGVLYVSRAADADGTCQGDFRSFVRTEPEVLVGTFSVWSSRSGYAEVAVPIGDELVGAGEPVLHAQFVWSNPPGCDGLPCAGAEALRSASDALSLRVHVPYLTGLAVTPTNPSLALGTGLQLVAMGTFSNGDARDLTSAVAWSSSDASVATVSSSGRVTGLSTGVAMITATDPASGLLAPTLLTVTPAVLTSLAVSPTNPSLALGTELQLAAIGTFSDGTTQDLTGASTWSSSGVSVATVSDAPGSRGLATGVSVGVATITATFMDIAAAVGVAGTTTLTVTPAVLVAVQVTPTNPAIALGTSRPFTAIGIYSDGTKQDLTAASTWSSSDLAVATLDDPARPGLATSVAVGTTVVAATDGASGRRGTTTLTVTPALLIDIQVTPAGPSIALGTSQQLTATGIYTDASTQDLTGAVTWSSSNAAVAAISNAAGSRGTAIGLAVGSTSVGAADPESDVNGATMLTVTPAVLVALEVRPRAPSLPLGTSQPLTAIGTYSDGSTQDLTSVVTWSSSDPDVARVSNAPGTRGIATSLAQGVTTIAALEPASHVGGATTLTVTPAVLVSLAVAPADASVALGFTRQLAALGTYSDGTQRELTSEATWSTSDARVAVVSNAPGSAGLATSLAVGLVSIAATEPASGIRAATTLTVTPAELLSMAVTPANATLARGLALQFTATGTYSDGTTQDLTSTATWSSSNPGVAVVSNAAGSRGLATGLALGVTTIAATDPGRAVGGATTLTVVGRRWSAGER